GFVACNDGLSIAEANYVASHPTCEGFLAVGLQDNGTIQRSSTGVWTVKFEGDGGGVAFDQVDTTRYLRQYINASWRSSDGGLQPLLVRGGNKVPDPSGGKTKPERESDRALFYSNVDTIKRPVPGVFPDVTQVLLGTDRIWYTEDWGAHWVTLPKATDPITATTYDEKQDQLSEPVSVCRWQSPDVGWVLTAQPYEQPGGQIFRLQRAANTALVNGPGTWTMERILAQSRKNKKDTTKADGPMRDAVGWTDIAVNLDLDGSGNPQQRGTKGALYLGTAGHPTKDDVDTLWWFDGTSAWHATKLRDELPAPVTAVLCDPKNPDHVYVGTTVGVLRGVRSFPTADAPAWDWHHLVNGLPEAAVEDLSLFDFDGLRLL